MKIKPLILLIGIALTGSLSAQTQNNTQSPSTITPPSIPEIPSVPGTSIGPKLGLPTPQWSPTPVVGNGASGTVTVTREATGLISLVGRVETPKNEQVDQIAQARQTFQDFSNRYNDLIVGEARLLSGVIDGYNAVVSQFTPEQAYTFNLSVSGGTSTLTSGNQATYVAAGNENIILSGARTAIWEGLRVLGDSTATGNTRITELKDNILNSGVGTNNTFLDFESSHDTIIQLGTVANR